METAIRANTLRIKERDLVERLTEKKIVLEKIPWVRQGYFVKNSPFSVGATTEYLLGHYFIHDPTSMYACEVLDPRPGETVLDMAAAPGGKTTYLSQLMGNSGTVIALELNQDRMRSLASNINRMGVKNAITIRMDAGDAGDLVMEFDKILLDAPCTGTGTLFKNPEAGKKEIADLEIVTKTQSNLINKAYNVLKEEGTLLYSTCSILPEENEMIVQEAIENLDIKLEKIKAGEQGMVRPYGLSLDKKIRKTRRFYPSLNKTQGFFMAKIKKV